ncbi:MAG: hypothetical protein JXR25_16805 [Pontiellaceae bacterium]|nr:hypothetical protein [Pontiellaceae bacterium]MBN2786483.1 hypothetical protein [Pontiellaceae bacterium]
MEAVIKAIRSEEERLKQELDMAEVLVDDARLQMETARNRLQIVADLRKRIVSGVELLGECAA